MAYYPAQVQPSTSYYSPPTVGGAVTAPTQGIMQRPARMKTEAELAAKRKRETRVRALAGGGQVAPPGYGQQNAPNYIQPRQSLGGPHATFTERLQANTTGYSPRTAGTLYGGRPVQMTQAQALVNNPFGIRATATRPFGGTNAVRRRVY